MAVTRKEFNVIAAYIRRGEEIRQPEPIEGSPSYRFNGHTETTQIFCRVVPTARGEIMLAVTRHDGRIIESAIADVKTPHIIMARLGAGKDAEVELFPLEDAERRTAEKRLHQMALSLQQ